MIGVARDITLRKRTEQQMVRAKERLDLALTSSQPRALGLGPEEQPRLLQRELGGDAGRPAARVDLLRRRGAAAGTIPTTARCSAPRIGNADEGRERGVRLRVPRAERRRATGSGCTRAARSRSATPTGKALRMTGTSTNITKRKRAEERAEYLATRDALTGLPNRVLLHDRLEQGVVNAARHQRRLRVHVHRPRPLQDHQRLARPPGGRRAAEARGARGSPPACAPPTPWRAWAATSSR